MVRRERGKAGGSGIANLRAVRKRSGGAKVIGLVGGIGPESTIDYYRLLLSRFRERGGAGAPRIVIDSIDVARLLALAGSGDREGLAEYLSEAIDALARAGAKVGLIAANTPHLVFDEVRRRSPIELVSIVEATSEAASAAGFHRVGLLGTRTTMEGSFYGEVLARREVSVVAPEAAAREFVHEKYVGELVAGKFLPETRAGFLAIIEMMREREGIEAVILGGTELPLLLRGSTPTVPLLDTTRIHVDAVIARVLGNGDD